LGGRNCAILPAPAAIVNEYGEFGEFAQLRGLFGLAECGDLFYEVEPACT
jgi:hypothetical protein